MSNTSKIKAARRTPTPKSAARDTAAISGGAVELVDRILAAVPVIWLVVAISAYTLLALHPPGPTQAEVPGMPEADRLAGPLLALVLVSGGAAWLNRRLQFRSRSVRARHDQSNP